MHLFNQYIALSTIHKITLNPIFRKKKTKQNFHFLLSWENNTVYFESQTCYLSRKMCILYKSNYCISKFIFDARSINVSTLTFMTEYSAS